MTAAHTISTKRVHSLTDDTKSYPVPGWDPAAFTKVNEFNAIPAKKDALGRWVPLFASRFISIDGVVYQWECDRLNEYGDVIGFDYRALNGAVISFVENHDVRWPSWEHPARRNRVKETLWLSDDGQVVIAIKKS